MVNWAGWQRTVKGCIRDRGVWVGLLDEDWGPIATLDPKDFREAYTRLAAPEVSFDHSGVNTGGVSTLVDELIAPDLGHFDARGYFEASNTLGRSICVAREDSRQAYFIPYVDAQGEKAPENLHVEAAGLLSLLDATPCPSVPGSWKGGWQVREANAAGPYSTPREYSLVEFSTRADGYTVTGPAETAIRTVIQDSLDAVQSHMGWMEPHMVVDYRATGVASPEAAIRVQDDFILPTVAETARTAGVNVWSDLWWPGDNVVLTRSLTHPTGVAMRRWSHPIAVVHVEQGEATDG